MPQDLLSIIDTTKNKTLRQQVIVQLTEAPNQSHDKLVKKYGGTVQSIFENIDALLVDMPISRLEKFAAEAAVDYITPNREVKGNVDSAIKLLGVDQLRTPAAGTFTQYPGLDGKGIGVAILDSGIDTGDTNEREFSNLEVTDDKLPGFSRIVASADFTNPDVTNGILYKVLATDQDSDKHGHGTAVAGIIAGNGVTSREVGADGRKRYFSYYGDYTGIAPKANIIALRILDDKGRGDIASVINALNFCTKNQKTYNIRVINISAGAPVVQSYKKDPLCKAAASAVSKGIVVVSSAGNNGHNKVVTGYDAQGKKIYQTVYGGIVSPGNDPSVITVGATTNPKESKVTWQQKNRAGQGWQARRDF